MKKILYNLYICRLVTKYFVDEKNIDFWDTFTVNYR